MPASNEITIDKNLPMPNATRASGWSKFPFKTMEVGDSFIYPTRADRGVRYAQTNAVNAARRCGDPSRKFATRIVVEDGQEVVRVWRIA
jgi:hypothetical protein